MKIISYKQLSLMENPNDLLYKKKKKKSNGVIENINYIERICI